ncbi:hypothetical protein, partial [Amycolatopsis sp. NPDC051071]|uniref:hypothetical protein n=1 Tax=Amycolatopsis sp. NPDC051071 TaxID=3154637 RepID=UPI00342763A6
KEGGLHVLQAGTWGRCEGRVSSAEPREGGLHAASLWLMWLMWLLGLLWLLWLLGLLGLLGLRVMPGAG